MAIFSSGEDFHASIAKQVFKLPGTPAEIKKNFPLQRQIGKTVTFSMMYGSGARNISEVATKDMKMLDPNSAGFSVAEAQEALDDYLKAFPGLAKWLESNRKQILRDGYIYSFFGRKRRLPNVFSSDKGVVGHTARSGGNFLVQSPSSDVNLLAAIEMQEYIEAVGMEAKIFALVHDSILAEVPDEEVEQYQDVLRGFVQADRGLNIPGTPIGCDFDIADDYSLGNYEKYMEGWRERHPEVVF